MAKKHRVKCRYCGRGFNVPVGEFPAALFKHIGKKHKEAAARRSKARKAAKANQATKTRRKGIISVPEAAKMPFGQVPGDTHHTTYGYRTFPICYGPCAGGPPHVHM